MHNNPANPHIVMIHKAYPPWVGGIERHIRDISEELVQRGWQVSVLVGNDCHKYHEETINGVHVYRLARWGAVLSQPLLPGYYRKLRKLKPDIIHVHAPFPLGWFAPGFVFASTPVFCTWHSDIVRQRFLQPLYQPLERQFLQRCNCIIPTSEPLMNYSPSLQEFKDKCRVIPLALREEACNDPQITSRAKEIKKKYAGKIVLFVGRLVGYKGLPYLIEAMRGIHAHLLLAGEGILRNELEILAAQMGKDKIHFLGHVDEAEKTALYRAADVFVLPSIERNEAFGYVLLEAMQQGCPVISTDLPTGVIYVNQHDITGFVVPPRDAQSLADTLNRILTDDGLRKSLSYAAKAWIASKFNFERVMDKLEEEYERSRNF